jgi:hypothetical protein
MAGAISMVFTQTREASIDRLQQTGFPVVPNESDRIG